jgi:uncharacterized membrane-anchored protein
MKPIVKLAIVVGVQLFILLSLIGFKQYAVWTADTVLLKAQPVDLHDLLRGDYVTVRYEISSLDLDDLAGDDDPFATIYVELQKQPDGYWDAVAVHDDRERSFDGTVLIEGETNYRDYRNLVEVHYGIEDVFIPEGSASKLPSGEDHTVAVEVKVDRWGHSVPREFYVDGEPFPLKRR